MNKAALQDLEKIENYHLTQEIKCIEVGHYADAQLHELQAKTVRACIVTIQAAEHREPDE